MWMKEDSIQYKLMADGKNTTIGNDIKGRNFKYLMYFPNIVPTPAELRFGFKPMLMYEKVAESTGNTQ